MINVKSNGQCYLTMNHDERNFELHVQRTTETPVASVQTQRRRINCYVNPDVVVIRKASVWTKELV